MHDPNTQSQSTSTPPLPHRFSSSSTQYITVPNSPTTPSSNNQVIPTLPTINKSTQLPLSPPPPSTHDNETAQEVDLALARRHSKPWMSLSLISPFSKKKGNTTTEEEDEEPEPRLGPRRSTTINKIFRPIPERNRTGNTTVASIKLDGLIRKHTLPLGEEREEKVLYRYAYVYENQRGWARFGTLKFSSRALKLFFHYRDPAALTKYETFEEEGTRKKMQINLPYASLRDVQLPSPEWAWQGGEWLIDMAGDGVVRINVLLFNDEHILNHSYSDIIRRISIRDLLLLKTLDANSTQMAYLLPYMLSTTTLASFNGLSSLIYTTRFIRQLSSSRPHCRSVRTAFSIPSHRQSHEDRGRRLLFVYNIQSQPQTPTFLSASRARRFAKYMAIRSFFRLDTYPFCIEIDEIGRKEVRIVEIVVGG
jgi:hypothetical protein